MDMPKKIFAGPYVNPNPDKTTGYWTLDSTPNNDRIRKPYVLENLERDRLVNELIEAVEKWQTYDNFDSSWELIVRQLMIEAKDKLKALEAE